MERHDLMSTNSRLHPHCRSKLCTIFGLITLLLLAGCASEEKIVEVPTTENPYALRIVNHTSNVVDNVKFKPCGTPTTHYATLTDKIQPQQKVMLNVYNLCVDLVAEDAFRQPLYQKTDLILNKETVWTLN